MTLRQRLLLRLFAVLGISLLIAGILAYGRAAAKVKTELHAALVVGEQVLIDAVKEIERSPSPYQQMRIVIERFSGGRHLKVTLLDSEHVRVASSRLAEPESAAPDWFCRLLGDKPELARVPLPTNVRGYSEFLIEADPRNEIQEFWEDLGYGFLVLIILSGLAGVLIHWTIGHELTPLKDLNRALSRIAEGDFAMRIPESGPNDLKAVSKGFNDMARRLEDSRAATTQLEVQLSTLQEEERAELARDLHDEIGPLLFSVSLDAAEVQKSLDPSAKPRTLERLESIRDSVSRSQKHVLRLLGQLRSGTIEDMGLEGCVSQLIGFWRSRLPHLDIRMEVPAQGVGSRLDTIAYRIIQESISNAVRHGQATLIEVFVATAPDGATRVMVQDNGIGLKSGPDGYGLRGMRERVLSRNGTLTVRARADGGGTLVVADFPPACPVTGAIDPPQTIGT